MESRVAESLLGSPAEMARLSQRVVRVGALAGVVSFLIFAVASLITGDLNLLVQALGPVLVTGVFGGQILLKKEDAGWSLLATSFVVIGTYRLVGDESTLIPAALGVVIIASIAMLFVTHRQLPVTLVIAATMFVVPWIWGMPVVDAVPLGLIMAMCFAFTAAIFYAIRNAATKLNQRFQILFERSPTAVIEGDWTAAIDYTRSEFSGKPERIRGFLGAYPDIGERAASLVKVIRINQAALDLLGLPSRDAAAQLGQAGKLSREWIEAYTEVLISLIEGKELVDWEFHATTYRGQPMWLNARSVNVSSGETPDGVLIALADITHLKAKEDAMNELIRSKDEFVASISHELRTPLTAVVGLTSEMAGGSLEGEEQTELIQLVSGQAQEMSYIIDDLLVAARAEMGTVAVALAEIDLANELAIAIEGVGVDLVEYPTASLPAAIGDGPRVRQILRNLLTNLERYGGERRRVIAGAEKNRVWLEIRDNGEGVSDEDAARIFEPYASAHTGVLGSVGLGLSVARRLAELMGGSLSYRREDGESVFRLELTTAGESLFV